MCGCYKVARERELVLDACIVRLMKRHKELSQAQLIADTITNCRTLFVPSATTVKQRIDKLIEREYLRKIDDGRYVVDALVVGNECVEERDRLTHCLFVCLMCVILLS
jgi:predicted transcriptional regulator of viral defense system